MGRSRKPFTSQGVRGFESHRFRHLPIYYPKQCPTLLMDEQHKKILLIGGAPGVGKSTLAAQLSKATGIPYISTDQIRAVIKSVATVSEWPDLFGSTLVEQDVEARVAQEYAKAEIVWRGVMALIEHCYPWGGCIIEGVEILPHLVSRDLSSQNIKTTFLVYAGDAQIVDVVCERGKLPFIKTKSPAQQELKIAEIKLLNHRLLEAAKENHFPTFNVCTPGTFDSILKIIETA